MVTIFLEVTFPSQAKVQFWPVWYNVTIQAWHSMAKYYTVWHSVNGNFKLKTDVVP